MLDELRKKPRILRENYAFWGALLFTGLITMVWLVSIPLRFSSVDGLSENESKAESVGAMSNFFGQVKENFFTSWNKGEDAVLSIDIEEVATTTDSKEMSDNTYTATTTNGTSSLPISSVRIATSSSRSVQTASSTEQN